VAALVLGIADVFGKYYVPKLGGFIVYVLMIAILLWRPQGLFTRGWQVKAGTATALRAGAAGAFALAGLGESPPWAGHLGHALRAGAHAALINEIAILALFALSLDLILGYAGIVSLGHAAFFGVGAYGAALFAKHVMPDPLVGLAVAPPLGAVLGLLTSPMIVRGTDLTRLMVTMGVALVLMELANKFDGLTGGADGLQGVVMGPLLGRFEFDLGARVASFYSLAVLFIAFSLLRRIVHSPFGLSLQALRDNRLRLAAIGTVGQRPAGRGLHAVGGAGRRGRARCWRRPPDSPRSTCSTSTAAPT
jgi:ABC-type branched-subunit amino acid transport system permease subunit